MIADLTMPTCPVGPPAARAACGGRDDVWSRKAGLHNGRSRKKDTRCSARPQAGEDSRARMHAATHVSTIPDVPCGW